MESGLSRTLLLVTIVAAIVFSVFPEVDLWMSGLFYRVDGGFYLKDAWWAVAIYESIPIIAITVGAGSLLLLIHNMVRKRQLGPFSNRFLLFVVAALAVGPGLVVNVGFKDNWGRARPRDVTEFAGSKQFTAALVPTDQCERNCSFVAGHPSVMYWLAALGFAAAARKRRNWIFAVARRARTAGWIRPDRARGTLPERRGLLGSRRIRGALAALEIRVPAGRGRPVRKRASGRLRPAA